MSITGFLRKIRDLKQDEIKVASSKVPIKEVRKKAETAKTVADFKKSLEKSCPGNLGIIAEIKKASPSKGDIRPDMDIKKYAKEYETAGACAISVLTEQFYFKGSMDDLKAAGDTVAIPLLRKDFTLSTYQIYEAKAFGASSILLINKLLEKDRLRDYIHLAREIKMEPLVEIHSEWELEAVLTAGASIIGVNNRNLETLETDLGVSKRVAPYFTKDVIPIEASGISSPSDIKSGMESGYFNFLVGESIVRADNTQEFIKELIKTKA